MNEIQKAADLAKRYNKITGKSVNISFSIWKFAHENKIIFETSLAVVDPDTYECSQYNMTLNEMADFIKSEDILFRKFT